MKNTTLLILSLFFTQIILSQSTLSAGDIAIIQYNASGNPEVIKFVALTSMESGTTINFTDNGWIPDPINPGVDPGTFRTGEANTPHTWTASGTVSCGDIITMNIPNGAFNLSTSGDQILAYQGTTGSPTFIYAMNNKGNKWQPTASSSTTSGIPDGLTVGVNSVAILKVNNVKYSGPLTGSKATVLANICDKANWNNGTTASSSNSTPQNFTDTFNTTWSSGTWDGTGSDFLNATINDTFNTGTDGNFSACNCTVNTSQTLTVNSGGTVTVENNITNNGTILVESGGSVVQDLSSGTNTGTDYTVERASTLQSSYHVFTYWSSPITSATFAAVAPSTHQYYSFNASSQSWVAGNAATPMNPGIGYALEGPDSGTYPGVQTSTFTGAPFNNGDISVDLSFSSDGDADNDWNLIGNPYPSAISANTFLADNSANIGGTLYFWTHNTVEDGTEDNTEDDYAMYTSGGGTAAVSGGSAPDGNIASGQGFFAQALTNGTVSNLFTNNMRIAGSNTTFFRSAQKKKSMTISKKDRIWLNLTVDKSFSQILIGFFNDATNEIDRKYDGKRFIGKTSLNFYSLIDNKEFGIQGLSKLKRKTEIPLGFSTNKTGTFKVAIDKREGKLSTSKIILFDKLLDLKHRLDKSDYEFESNEIGLYNERFELIIKPEKIKFNENSKKIKTHRKDNRLILESLSDNVKLKRVRVYSLNGRLSYNKKVNDFETSIKLNKFKKRRIYVLKIRLSSGEIIVKKMIF